MMTRVDKDGYVWVKVLDTDGKVKEFKAKAANVEGGTYGGIANAASITYEFDLAPGTKALRVVGNPNYMYMIIREL